LVVTLVHPFDSSFDIKMAALRETFQFLSPAGKDKEAGKAKE
jgi:hypothetical protein